MWYLKKLFTFWLQNFYKNKTTFLMKLFILLITLTFGIFFNCNSQTLYVKNATNSCCLDVTSIIKWGTGCGNSAIAICIKWQILEQEVFLLPFKCRACILIKIIIFTIQDILLIPLILIRGCLLIFTHPMVIQIYPNPSKRFFKVNTSLHDVQFHILIYWRMNYILPLPIKMDDLKSIWMECRRESILWEYYMKINKRTLKY